MFTKEKPKMIAIRPMLFIFVCIILLLLCAFFILTSQYIGFSITVATFFALVIYCCLKKRYILSIAMLIISLFCAVSLILNHHNFVTSKLDEGKEYLIVGRADEFTTNSGYGYARILENCTIYLDGVIVAENKKIKLFLSENDVECGDEITFKSKLTNFEYFTSSGITSEGIKGINYSANVAFSNIENINKTPIGARERIKLHAQNVLGENMSEQGFALAYAVVFGDKSYLDFDARNAFTESGMAHILAVSGLHASMIFGLLISLLSITRMKYKHKLIIVSLFIIFFTYLCDFAPSIMRASIMAIVLAVSCLGNQKYDMLNVLGLSGIIILILNPLDVFNIGFVLSFSCMYSMAIWSNVSNKFSNIIINRRIYADIVASTVTSIGTLPCMAFYFGNFSLVSILTNVLLLPIFTLTYAILFLIVVICLILPIPLLLSCADAVLLTVLDFNKFFTFWELDYIKILKIGLIGLIISFAMFYISCQKFNIKNKIKIPLTIFLICCIVASAIYSSTSKLNEDNLIKLDGEDNYCIISNNETILINSLSNSSNLKVAKEYLRENSETEIEYIYIFSFNFVNKNSIESFSREFNVKNIYITEQALVKFNIYFEMFTNAQIHVLENEHEYQINEIMLTFNDFGENGTTLKFDFLNKSHVISFKE